MSIFGSIGNFLFGNGNTATTNQTSTRTPYAPAVPYVKAELPQLSTLYNGGAPQISPLEQQGYSDVSNVAQNPTAAFTDAGTQLDNTIKGDYLTPDTNPYLADIAKRVGDQAFQTTNSEFGSKGRTGGGLAGYYAGKGVGDALTNLYGTEYNTERGLQAQATSQAPGFQQAQYLAPQAEISAGQNVSARPFDIANQYSGILNNIANLGGTTTSSGTSQPANNGGIVGQAVSSFTNKLFQ